MKRTIMAYSAPSGELNHDLETTSTPCQPCTAHTAVRSAHAGPYVGVYIGGPYYRPYWGGPYYYYRPVVPLYVAPPIVVQPAPVVPGPAISTTPPTTATLPYLSPPQTGLNPPRMLETRGDEIDRLLDNLFNQDEKVRADAAIQLGRMKARRAAEPLERVLTTDRSAEVREAAARGLGLIGAPASVRALQRAAQNDEDRGVRNSAQFAVDVIRGR